MRGRFINTKSGSSMFRPLHGSRHRASQMKYFSGRGFKARAALGVQRMFPNIRLK